MCNRFETTLIESAPTYRAKPIFLKPETPFRPVTCYTLCTFDRRAHVLRSTLQLGTETAVKPRQIRRME